jgi:hypothetical protein
MGKGDQSLVYLPSLLGLGYWFEKIRMNLLNYL